MSDLQKRMALNRELTEIVARLKVLEVDCSDSIDVRWELDSKRLRLVEIRRALAMFERRQAHG